MKVPILPALVLTFALCANAWAIDLCSSKPNEPVIGTLSETLQDVFNAHNASKAPVCTVQANELTTGEYYSFDGLVIVEGNTPNGVKYDINGKFVSTGNLENGVVVHVYSPKENFPYDKAPAIIVTGNITGNVTLLTNGNTHVNGIDKGARLNIETINKNPIIPTINSIGPPDYKKWHITPRLPKQTRTPQVAEQLTPPKVN